MARTRNDPPSSTIATSGSPPEQPSDAQSPLSLSRLREAFAAMLGQGSQPAGPAPAEPQVVCDTQAAADPCEINPRSVVEAMLFVGRPDGGALAAREMAATMRGVSPAEIDAAVTELNKLYLADGAPYAIVGSSKGYRLQLRDDFQRMRDKFHGRVRETKLSPAALEVLAVVAYNQPVSADDVSQLRGAASGAALATLVRHKLLRIDRPGQQCGCRPEYATTERFLRLFGLENLASLPRSDDLEKC